MFPTHSHMAFRLASPMLVLTLAIFTPSMAKSATETMDRAQEATDEIAKIAPEPPVQPQPHTGRHRIEIGRATDDLLALQRSGAGQRPRPIDGEQASRSYQRYLKSFETTIPEHYSTGIDAGSGSR